MGKKLAIMGHPTRGNEVIKLLEIMGGNIDKKIFSAANIGDVLNPNVYFFDPDSSDNRIVWYYLLGLEHDGRASEMMIFTLEEFLEKYPFYNGDKVFDIADGDPGIITAMKWDEDVSDMKYHVAFDNGDMGWYTNDTIEFLKGDKNLEERKTSVKNHKMGPKSKLPSKYYEEKLKKTQSNQDKSIFMVEHSMWPIVKDGFLEYKIVDGYEIDKIENGNIILKPIKPKYPTTYDECCDMLNADEFVGYELMTNFPKLINARNAYWKIAGEQMGLGKSWESPLPSLFETVYCIRRKNNEIIKGAYRGGKSEILEFPTEEMRDAFYENFKDLIEQCKELF